MTLQQSVISKFLCAAQRCAAIPDQAISLPYKKYRYPIKSGSASILPSYTKSEYAAFTRRKKVIFFGRYAIMPWTTIRVPKSGNLLVKFLCAAADYAAIPEKYLLFIRMKTIDTWKARWAQLCPSNRQATRGRVEICPQISLRGDRYSNDTWYVTNLSAYELAIPDKARQAQLFEARTVASNAAQKLRCRRRIFNYFIL